MPVIEKPAAFTEQEIQSSLAISPAGGALRLTNITGPVRQMVQEAVKQGKNPNIVKSQLLTRVPSPSAADYQRFMQKPPTVLHPVGPTSSPTSPASGIGIVGAGAAIISAILSAVSTPPERTPTIESTYPPPPSPSGVESLPTADLRKFNEIVRQSRKEKTPPKPVVETPPKQEAIPEPTAPEPSPEPAPTFIAPPPVTFSPPVEQRVETPPPVVEQTPPPVASQPEVTQTQERPTPVVETPERQQAIQRFLDALAGEPEID